MPQVKNEAGFFAQIGIIRAYKGMPQVKNEVGFLHKSSSGIFSACARYECGQNRSADLSRTRGHLNLKPAPGGVLLEIHGGGVLPCSLNPDPLSD